MWSLMVIPTCVMVKGRPEDIEIVLIDIKSGGARLTKGQVAIAQAIQAGRVRFETVRIDFDTIE